MVLTIQSTIFIAEISTANPTWMSGMMFCRDLLIPFIRQKILLNNITLSEGIHRDPCKADDCKTSHKLMKFNVKIDNENLLSAECIEKYNEILKENEYFFVIDNINIEDSPGNNIKNDIMVAIPHGMVGRHAFYSILENFLRNSAKNDNRNGNGRKLEINITLDKDTYKDVIVMTITDNVGNCNKEILGTLNEALEEPLVNGDGKINKGSWGVKEKRISANFLRLGSPTDIDTQYDFPPKWSEETKSKKLKMLEVACNTNCSSCSAPNLSYRFYLLKPKEALIVMNTDFDKGQKEQLKNAGIYSMEAEKFNDKFIENGVPHRFLVMNNTGENNYGIINKNKSYLPYRIICCNDDLYDHNIVKYYKKWLEKKFDNNLPPIVYREPAHEKIKQEDDLFKKIKSVEDFNSLNCSSCIVFDRHKKLLEKCTKNKKVKFYQSFSGDDAVYRLLSSLKEYSNDKKKLQVKVYEIIEAGLSNVLIADERIWSKSKELETKSLLKLIGICIVPIKNNRIYTKTLKKFLILCKPHFFVMHQGLIDKLETDQKSDLDRIIKEFEETNQLNYIVTSGRGLPRCLPDNARFLELSTLEQLIEERDKYGLVQTLYALRRQRDEQ